MDPETASTPAHPHPAPHTTDRGRAILAHQLAATGRRWRDALTAHEASVANLIATRDTTIALLTRVRHLNDTDRKTRIAQITSHYSAQIEASGRQLQRVGAELDILVVDLMGALDDPGDPAATIVPFAVAVA